MKILITTYHLRNYEGTETYTYTLALKLKDLKNEVVIYSPFLGKMAQRIKKHNICVVDDLKKIKGKKFDIIHAQHNITAIQARIMFPDTPLILNVHGVLPELEKLPFLNIGINKYIAVSEEIKNVLKKRVREEKIEIIRNFVDTKRYKPTKLINKKLKNVLIISNRILSNNIKMIEQVSIKLGFKVNIIGLKQQFVWNVEQYINNSDLIIALGRGVVEAMSSGRVALVYDYNGGDGMITQKSYYEIRKNNFSGRRYNFKYTDTALINEIKKYNPSMGKMNKQLARKYHCVDKNVKKLIGIYKNVIKNSSVQFETKIIFKIFTNNFLFNALPFCQFVINKIIRAKNKFRRAIVYGFFNNNNKL